MSLARCAETLRQQDPDRFGALLVAPPRQRAGLITLYALNLEIARAPLQSAEPLLAEMRLQWWIDRLAEMGQGREPPLHDVLTPLWDAWSAEAATLAALAEARRRDCQRRPFETAEDVLSYVDATAGMLMRAAAAHLGAAPAEAVAAQARGAGVAAWLRALPGLQGLGLGLADPADDRLIAALAGAGLEGFAEARKRRRAVPRMAAAALYPGPTAARFLKAIARGQLDPRGPVPGVAPVQRRASLAWLALTGRWWR